MAALKAIITNCDDPVISRVIHSLHLFICFKIVGIKCRTPKIRDIFIMPYPAAAFGSTLV